MKNAAEMACTQCRQQFTALDKGELPPADRADVQAHLAACADCRQALQDMRGVFSLLDHEEAPSPALRQRFLSAIAPTTAPAPATAAPTLFQRLWPSRPAWAFAYSCCLVLCGLATGLLLPHANSPALAADGFQICPVQSPAAAWLPAITTRKLS